MKESDICKSVALCLWALPKSHSLSGLECQGSKLGADKSQNVLQGWSGGEEPQKALPAGLNIFLVGCHCGRCCGSPLEGGMITSSPEWWTGSGDKAEQSRRPQSSQEVGLHQREPSSGTTHRGQGVSGEQRWTSDLGADLGPHEGPVVGSLRLVPCCPWCPPYLLLGAHTAQP